MAKKNKKSKNLEKALLHYFTEQTKLSNQKAEDMNGEALTGISQHVKAAQQMEAQRAAEDSEQFRILWLCFKEHQQIIRELENELVRANKKIKSLKNDVENSCNKSRVLGEQIYEVNHKLGFLKKDVKKQKQETKQLVVIAKSIGSILKICKMSDSLGKAQNKFLDASSEAKALRKNEYQFGNVLKIIDGEYREVPK